MISRYERHIILPEIGEEGQQKLSSAKAVVVGAGGLGSAVLYYLASAGIGHIKIIDSDIVEITNLNRQFIHFESDIGREKSLSAKEKLQQYNHEISISSVTVRLNDENIQEYLSGYDVVVSCVDNKPTRYLLNSSCVKSGIPLIDGGVRGFEGYTLTVLPGVTPCYHCIFPVPDKSTAVTGVLGATAGVIGSMMAVQTIKVLLGIRMDSYFHYIDLFSFNIIPMQAQRNPDCPVCNSHR